MPIVLQWKTWMNILLPNPCGKLILWIPRLIQLLRFQNLNSKWSLRSSCTSCGKRFHYLPPTLISSNFLVFYSILFIASEFTETKLAKNYISIYIRRTCSGIWWKCLLFFHQSFLKPRQRKISQRCCPSFKYFQDSFCDLLRFLSPAMDLFFILEGGKYPRVCGVVCSPFFKISSSFFSRPFTWVKKSRLL